MNEKSYHKLFELLLFKSDKHRLKVDNGVEKVFDPVRTKWLVLTPEEVVRQAILRFLNESFEYPFSVVNCEGGFKLGERTKRPDAVYYKDGKPVMLVECKSPFVEIDQKVLDQASRYNLHFKVPYILLTNGLMAFVFKENSQGMYEILKEMPRFSEINTTL